MATKGTVGVIGLGIMGGAFAHNLTAAGWRVTGYDLDPKRRRALAKDGVEIMDGATAVAAEAATILTTLPSPRAPHDTMNAIVAAKAGALAVYRADPIRLDRQLQ